MRFSFSFLFAVLVSACFGQTGNIVGTVYDDKGQPITGAAVIYKKDVTIGSTSDFDGKYTLELPIGQARLVCRSTGMITDTFIVTVFEGKTITRDIILQPFDVQEIDEVEVKVGKFDRPFEDQTVSMEVLKPELIENKNTRSIETALDQTPGLNILDGEPQIRGGSGFTFGVGSKVAVIVDDMPMLSGDAGRPEWGFIPVENIHQIEVIKGASSVLSGSSALSGAIHIRTKYPSAQPLTKVNVYSGMYSKPSVEGAGWWNNFPLITGTNILHSRQMGNLDLVVGGNLNYDHGYIGPPVTDSLVFPDTISNFNERQMSLRRARLNFNMRYRSKRFSGLNYGLNGNFMTAISNLSFAWLNDSSGLFQGYPGAVFLQNQFIFNVDPYLNFFTQTDGKHSFRTRLLHADNVMTAGQSNKATTLYGDYMFSKSYKEVRNLDFVGGLTGTYTDSYASLYAGSGSPNNQLLNVSAYSQVDTKLKNIVNVSVGGRLEYFQLNDTITAMKPIFRAGTSLKLYQETYLRASYGQGYRFPTITERFIKTGVGNFGVFPNPQLKPESSWNAEVGIKQGLKLGSIYGYLDVAAFWQEYQNTIEYLFGFWGDPVVDGSSIFGFKFLNTGKSKVIGLDLSFSGKAKISDNVFLTFMTGYNYIVPKTLNPDYVYATDNTPGNPKPYSYNNTSLDSSSQVLKYRFLHNAKADFELTVKKKLAIGVSFKYFSKIVNMDGVIQEFEDATQGPFVQTIRYMDYFANHRFGNPIFDARISYNFSEMHKLALISSNLLNRTYSLRPLKIEAPRTIMLQYTFKLDKN